MPQTVFLSFNANGITKKDVLVVKRYAIRKAKIRRQYAVSRLQMKQYAVRNGEGGGGYSLLTHA